MPGHRMRWRQRPYLLVAVALLAGCAKVEPSAVKAKDPFVLEAIEGTELMRLRLEPQAVKRTDIGTGTVEGLVRFGSGPSGRRIPYGAVMYEPDGDAFVYTNPERNVYVRHPIVIDYVEGEIAVLTAGPDEGTTVVTDGAAELYGMETGVGK